MSGLDPGRERKHRIAGHFGRAAAAYDTHAGVQAEIARRLAGRLGAEPRPARVLEIGCGTGLLSLPMAGRWPDASFLFTDLAPEMLARCRDNLGAGGLAPGAAFCVMDGEWPAVAPLFDLVVSSLVFQWFGDVEAALARLADALAPGGRLVFATLGAGTFQEWRRALAAAGLASGVPDLPAAADLARAWPADGPREVEEEHLVRRYAGPRAFLHGLRAIGAHLPAPGYRPLSAGRLRAVIRRLEAEGEGFVVTRHVLYGRFVKPG